VSSIKPLSWLIIGGGLHGSHMAIRLLGDLGVPPSSLKILDPEPQLMRQWKRRTHRTGMTHLRSPSVHHIDIQPMSLKKYRWKDSESQMPSSIPPYDRPSLNLFNSHCDHLVHRYRLEELHVQAFAKKFKVEKDFVRVQLSTGEEIISKKIILAMGMRSPSSLPQWAPKESSRFHHIFQRKPLGIAHEKTERTIVVGGGISAIQTALSSLLRSKQVKLIIRHQLRVHQFDSDSGWLGAKNMRAYSEENCLKKRRRLIKEARHRGSIPPDLKRALKIAEKNGLIDILEDEVVNVQSNNNNVEVYLMSGKKITADNVILATGLETKRPGGALVDQLISDEGLPCAPCGYPVTDWGLRWHPNIHVMGPLAELELGPVARNIAGARRAADRIIDFAEKNTSVLQSLKRS
jgi:pyruvate/2-oxoglutarate dehydrogenase complex dihydrolipoamide dehydrogenase (E3) component